MCDVITSEAAIFLMPLVPEEKTNTLLLAFGTWLTLRSGETKSINQINGKEIAPLSRVDLILRV